MDPCDKVLRHWVGEDFPMYEHYAKKLTAADGRVKMVALKKIKYPSGSPFYHEKDDIFLATPRDSKVLLLTKNAEPLHPEKHKHLIKPPEPPKRSYQKKKEPTPKPTASTSEVVFDDAKPLETTKEEKTEIATALTSKKRSYRRRRSRKNKDE